MLTWIGASWTFCLLFIGLHFGSVNGYGHEKNDELEKKVDAVINELKRLKDQFAAFQADMGIARDDVSSLLLLTPLEVSRKSFSQGVEFRLKYRITQPCQVVISWQVERMADDGDLYFEDIDLHVIDQQAGEWTTNMVAEPRITRAVVMVSASSLSYRLILVNRPEGKDETMKISSLPPLEIEPKGDIVYDEGKDVLLEVTVPLKQERGPPDSYVDTTSSQLYGSFVDPDSGQFRYISFGQDYFVAEPVETFLDSEKAIIKVTTSSHPVSGWLTFMGAEVNHQDLLQRIELIKRRVIRPSSQAGPFPRGYLEFESDPTDKKDDEGRIERYCLTDERCKIHCLAVGEKVADLSVTKLLSDGSQEQLEFDGKAETGGYTIEGVLFTMAPSKGDHQDIFTCTVSDLDGQLKTKSIKMIYYSPIKIIKEASGVTWLNEDEINVTCVAAGTPLPKIQLDIQWESVDNSTTTVLADDRVASSSVFNVTAWLLEFNNFYIWPQGMTAACNAYSTDVPYWNSDKLVMVVPDTNEFRMK